MPGATTPPWEKSQLPVEEDSDDTEDELDFQSRLMGRRDEGCVICLAPGLPSAYRYVDDSEFFPGVHLIPCVFQSVVNTDVLFLCLSMLKRGLPQWDVKDFVSVVTDPHTNPQLLQIAGLSQSSGLNSRTDSLNNGMLMCLDHHQGYQNFHYSIHPEVETSSCHLCFVSSHNLL